MTGTRVKEGILWLLLLVAGSLVVYQVASFIPQPLDAPNTLRPVLNNWFVGYIKIFPSPQTAYFWWRALGLLALLTPPMLALRNYSREHSRWLFLGSIGLSLLVCRFPTLLDYQLNPDEGEFLSAAHKLFYNANFFSSVDCGTSGPLNIYPLMLPAAIGISPDYASSRFITLVIAFGVICLLYGAFRQLSSDKVARFAVLPVAEFFASLEHPNLTHYSSEQIPLLFIATSFYLCVRVICHPVFRGWVLFALGLLTGAAFFSKMQSVPIVGTLAAIALAFSYFKRQRPVTLPFLAGVCLLPVGNAILCFTAGVMKDFWVSYIISNQRYTDLSQDSFFTFAGFLVKTGEIRVSIFVFLSLVAVLAIRKYLSGFRIPYRLLAVTVPLLITAFGVYLSLTVPLTNLDMAAGLALLGAVIACLTLIPFRYPRHWDSHAWATLGAVCATSAAVYSIHKPHRLFPHYLLLLLPPLSILAGLFVIRLVRSQAGARTITFVALIAFANEAYPWGAPLLHPISSAGFHNVVPTIRAPEGDLIRNLTRPGERIFVWGWTADPYLSSGRVSSARDLNLFYEFSGNSEISAHYLARLAKDLRANPPVLFVDAVGRESWMAQSQQQFGFEQFPDLMWFIRINYVMLPDAYGDRYFLRNDLAERAGSVPFPQRCGPSSLRCLTTPERVYTFEGSLVSSVAYLPPIQIEEQAEFQIELTPMAKESPNATVFGNGLQETDFKGFRFQNAGKDHYRLLLGLGDRWVSSQLVRIPFGTQSSVRIVFAGTHVSFEINGKIADQFELPSRIVDSEGPITVGSSIGGTARFNGLISFFEIR